MTRGEAAADVVVPLAAAEATMFPDDAGAGGGAAGASPGPLCSLSGMWRRLHAALGWPAEGGSGAASAAAAAAAAADRAALGQPGLMTPASVAAMAGQHTLGDALIEIAAAAAAAGGAGGGAPGMAV